MNERTTRGLLVAGLSSNVLFLMLALLDYALGHSQYMWPIFVGWAFVIILVVILALAATGIRVQVIQQVAAPTPVAVPAPAAPAKPAPAAMGPFSWNGWTLYSREVELKNGGKRPIYFFSKHKPKSGSAIAKPAGFHVGVNERTGLPFLKRGVGHEGEDLTPTAEHHYRPQCSALTEDGKQCRNSARADSKYCASHFGYQPPVIAKAEAKRDDTLPRNRNARDTLPSVRRAPA
jgi:hypothetical protein